jgi:hypothetical protein
MRFWCFSYSQNSMFVTWSQSTRLGRTLHCRIDPGHGRAGPRQTQLDVLLPCKPARPMMWTHLSECVLRSDVLNGFSGQQFTGFKALPMSCSFKDQSCQLSLPVLHELNIVGWGGVASPESGVHLVDSCPACGHQTWSVPVDRTRLVDVRDWDGSDFFMLWPFPRITFVSDRAAKYLGRWYQQDIQLARVEDFEFPIQGIVSPGRLSDWMDEVRAQRLGGQLGIV